MDPANNPSFFITNSILTYDILFHSIELIRYCSRVHSLRPGIVSGRVTIPGRRELVSLDFADRE